VLRPEDYFGKKLPEIVRTDAEWAGFETVGQCEFAEYPAKVLEKHWPAVPRWRDIHELTAKSFFERTGLHTVNLISGGSLS